jgi:hypothetical protein
MVRNQDRGITGRIHADGAACKARALCTLSRHGYDASYTVNTGNNGGRRATGPGASAGVSVHEAWNTRKSAHCSWRLSKTPALTIALPLRFFTKMELPNLAPG